MSNYTYEIFQLAHEDLPLDFVDNLPARFAQGGTIIHNARNQIKVFSCGALQVNVKKFCIPPIVNRILYSIGWRIPKAKKTFMNAEEIIKRGFDTPKPLGYRIERNYGLIDYSYFVSEQIQNAQPIGHQCTDKELIRALARYTAKLHQAGLLHKDYTPGNILYRKTADGKFHFILVDINRFRCHKKPFGKWGVINNLMQPFHDDELLKFFVLEYAAARGFGEELYKPVLWMRHLRNTYDATKRALKKLPGAYIFLNKPLKKEK